MTYIQNLYTHITVHIYIYIYIHQIVISHQSWIRSFSTHKSYGKQPLVAECKESPFSCDPLLFVWRQKPQSPQYIFTRWTDGFTHVLTWLLGDKLHWGKSHSTVPGHYSEKMQNTWTKKVFFTPSPLLLKCMSLEHINPRKKKGFAIHVTICINTTAPQALIR